MFVTHDEYIKTVEMITMNLDIPVMLYAPMGTGKTTRLPFYLSHKTSRVVSITVPTRMLASKLYESLCKTLS